MTNYEKIMSEMTIEKMAELQVVTSFRYDDFGCAEYIYFSHKSELPWIEEENAVEEELAFLKQEHKENEA